MFTSFCDFVTDIIYMKICSNSGKGVHDNMSNKSYPIKENSNVMKVQGGEQKVMKKILTVALSTAMAFSMFASVAFGDSATAVTPQEKFDALAAKGIFNGYPDKQAHLEKDMTRAEFAKVITKLLGLKEVTGTLSYKDKGYDAKNWAVPYIEAVTAAGIMEGQDTVKKIFNYNGKVTVQEMATVLTRALKLEVPATADNSASAWAKGYVQAAIDKGLIAKDLNFQANASRSQLVEAAYAIDQMQNVTVASYKVVDPSNVEFTLNTGEVVKVKLEKALEANKETEVKFKNAAGQEITAKVTYVVTTATKVEKASASNLKQIVVTFDGEVDKGTAEDASNYSTTAGAVKTAVLSEDGKSVVLTLGQKSDLSEISMTNQKTYKVTVTNVKAGDKVISVTDLAFTPLDNTLPTVTAVKSLGNKAVKVEFSEPVKTATSANFQIDGKTYYGAVDKSTNEVVLQPYDSSVLSIGAHKLTVSLVEDYAGLKSLSSDSDFTVVEDKEAPTATEISATLEAATVTFSEDIDPSTVAKSDVYWLSGTTKKYANDVIKVSGNKYIFDFTNNPLPAYETTLYIDSVSDYSGNANTVKEYKIHANVDQTRPEVSIVSFDPAVSASQITVKFNKAVDAADKKYFTLTDKDGKAVAIKSVTAADSTKKVFTINLYSSLPTGANALKIAGIRDLTTLQNTMLDYNTTVSAGDTTRPVAADITVSSSSANKTVLVTYPEVMDAASISNPANYLIRFNGALRQLPSDATITVVQGGKGALIQFPDEIGTVPVVIASPTVSSATLTKIQIVGVKDAAGNLLDTYSTGELTVSENNAVAKAYDTSKYGTDQAVFVDDKTIKVKFDQVIGTVKPADFVLKKNGINVAIASATANASNVVTLTTVDSVGTDAAALALSFAPGQTIKTSTGNGVTPSTLAIHDVVAPVIQLGTNQNYLAFNGRDIIVPFSETLDTTAIGLYANDLVVTDLSDPSNPLTPGVTGNVKDYVTTIASANGGTDNAIKITLSPSVNANSNFSVQIASTPRYIQDTEQNVVSSSSVYETGANAIAVPSAPSITSSATSSAAAYTVTGVAEKGSTVSITVNDGTPVTVVADATTGAYSQPVTLVAGQDNTIKVTASNATGTSTAATKTVTVDTVAPTFVATGVDNTITVVFSEKVKPSDANNVTKYSYRPAGGATPVETIQSAVLGADGKTVTLTTTTPVVPGTSTIDAIGVNDLAGNASVTNAVTLQ